MDGIGSLLSALSSGANITDSCSNWYKSDIQVSPTKLPRNGHHI